MPTRSPNADDMIASLMQEMGQQQGYQDENSVAPTQANGSDNIELAQTRENITLVRNESEGFGFVIMSSPRFVYKIILFRNS